MTTRRDFIKGLGAGLAATTLPGITLAQGAMQTLTMPPLLDATTTGRFDLTAQAGETNFLGRSATDTWGFNQNYLGPTIRVRNKGDVAGSVKNTLREEISVHWHGALVPGDVDGGPHQPVKPGQTWKPVLPFDQPAGTLWYHSHIHGETGRQVYNGLAGMLQLSDDQDATRGLPSDYGIDDLPLVLQDRNFDWRGRAKYDLGMHESMMGFLGDTMLVNGQANAIARVPKGIVRLRLLNGSNSRVYLLSMSDGRPMFLAAVDAGILDHTVPLKQLAMGPGERAEVLVDFGNGKDVALVSSANPNPGMGGGGMMRGQNSGQDTGMMIMPFAVDTALPARITKMPTNLGGDMPDLPAEGAIHREFTLEMGMGGGMMRMLGMGGNRFSINGAAMDMNVINVAVKQGSTERWTVSGQMMMHPFHVHGASYQVISENGGPPRLQNRGWKDTVLVNGQVDLLMRFDLPANKDKPYMYHCHILEHEDGGMMGQFTVT